MKHDDLMHTSLSLDVMYFVAELSMPRLSVSRRRVSHNNNNNNWIARRNGMNTCDKERVIEARRPNTVVVDKEEHKGTTIDIDVPYDVRVGEKELEKVEKYKELKRETGGLWKLQHVEVVPAVIGALGNVTKDFER